MRDVPSSRPSCNLPPRSASAAPSHGADPGDLAEDLREAASLVAASRPDVAERLLARVAKLEAGASLADLAAAGDDGAAALVIEYDAAHRAAPLILVHEDAVVASAWPPPPFPA